jgi:hypothetical protein
MEETQGADMKPFPAFVLLTLCAPGVRAESPSLFGPDRSRSILANAAAHAAALGLPRDVPAPAAFRPGRDARREPARGQASAAPVPFGELEEVVKFGHRPAPIIGGPIDAWYRRHRDPNSKSARSEALARSALELIGGTPEGRELLRTLAEEFKASGQALVIDSQEFPGSQRIRRNGIEGVVGRRGESGGDATGGERCTFNELFLEFQDRDFAVQNVAAILAHEIRHIVTMATIDRVSPEARDILSKYALLFEQRARQTGYIVALRSGKGDVTVEMRAADFLAKNPERFWSDLKTSYSTVLDTSEMNDPAAAYRRRVESLEGVLRERKDFLGERLPRRFMAIEILSKKEGLQDSLKDVLQESEGDAKRIPQEIQGIERTIDNILKALSFFETSEGREFIAGIRQAARCEAYRMLEKDFEADQKALEDAARENPLPPAKSGGQLGWKEFNAAVRKSRQLHPEYWKEYLDAFPHSPQEL